jgi:site-specific DNA-methyltransferase (adenine-specific)
MLDQQQIYQGDCRVVLAGLPEASIDLIVTSPPYNVGIPYDVYDDALPYGEYLAFTREWLAACLRVAKPDGRLCLNIPLDTATNGPIGSVITALALKTGWQYKATIVWNEGNLNKGTAWGSWLSASAPHVIAPVELIVVLYREHWKKQERGTSDMTADEFKAWAGAGGVWKFSGATRNVNPVPFPVELPRRCIKLFSYVGNTVLDPFAGSGTTLLAAQQLRRRAIGVELSEQYCAEAVDRVSTLWEQREINGYVPVLPAQE